MALGISIGYYTYGLRRDRAVLVLPLEEMAIEEVSGADALATG